MEKGRRDKEKVKGNREKKSNRGGEKQQRDEKEIISQLFFSKWKQP